MEQMRRLSQRSLLVYIKQTFPNYMVGEHHKQIVAKLQAVERGDIKRLIIITPPRHGKSTIVSQRFPSWYISKHPRSEMIAVSATGRLAAAFGRRVRNLMRERTHGFIFPDTMLAVDSQAANEWHTEQGGVFISAGIGGSIVGRGADLLSIDDPISGREMADSPHQRETSWQWYLSDARTRLHPGGSIVLTTTRWHIDDLCGRIKKQMQEDGEQWDMLHLKALDDDGKALWEERYPATELEIIKKAIGDRAWSALYQGEPRPDGGLIFGEEHFATYDYQADFLDKIKQHGWEHFRFYGSSDYAVSEEEGDYTVHLIFAVDPVGRIHLVNRYREQASADKWIQAMCQLVRQYRIDYWAEESGQIIKSVGPFLENELRKTRSTYGIILPTRKQYSSATDKVSRARSAQGRFGIQPLLLPRDQPWAEEYKQEMLDFFAGEHDDQVDATSLFCRMLDKLRPGESPAPPMPEPEGILDQPLSVILGSMNEPEGVKSGWEQ